MMDCYNMPEEAWGERFSKSCYFYPARDCPGYVRGKLCGRIGQTIPIEERMVNLQFSIELPLSTIALVASDGKKWVSVPVDRDILHRESPALLELIDKALDEQ
jgi:hypothetical protein